MSNFSEHAQKLAKPEGEQGDRESEEMEKKMKQSVKRKIKREAD